MTVNHRTTKSVISLGCFYAAGYFCLAATLLLTYQTLVWLKQGAWLPYRMWLVLEWAGWHHSPSVFVGRAQPLVDWIWDALGNCPITIALSAATILVTIFGYVSQSASIRAAELRDAH